MIGEHTHLHECPRLDCRRAFRCDVRVCLGRHYKPCSIECIRGLEHPPSPTSPMAPERWMLIPPVITR